MICQDCGVEAATKYVAFYQNIGALILRFTTSVEGNLCKSCIHKHFWSTTTITALAGWWGIISFIMTPFILLNNIIRYLFCLGMPAAPNTAMRPQLTNDAYDRISPHEAELFDRVNAGEDFTDVVEVIADRAGVTPGQVVLFVQEVIRRQEQG